MLALPGETVVLM